MSASILLDSSYLITLVDSTRANHLVAKQYYQWILENQIPMHFSTIVATELAIKQPITDFPLRNFRALPFNIDHSTEAARIWNALERDKSDSRSVVRDDVKIMAQAEMEGIPFILTEDANTLTKYCEQLRTRNLLKLRPIKLVDGFDDYAFQLDGQKGLALE